jgi:hypothetical protein
VDIRHERKHTLDQAIAWLKSVNNPASPSAKANTVVQNLSDDGIDIPAQRGMR